ncbi:MAG: hypothetical protein ACK52U_08805 [Synechococcaceae cyanobacterium]|jgi:hypothetical protein
MQTRALLPRMKILLHWHNKHDDELADPLPAGVDLQGVMAGGLVEVYRTRRQPLPKEPLPQRNCAALAVAAMVIGAIVLMTWLLPVFLFGCLILTTVVAPIGIGRELCRQRRAVK